MASRLYEETLDRAHAAAATTTAVTVVGPATATAAAYE
jgi:hypothetical protein